MTDSGALPASLFGPGASEAPADGPLAAYRALLGFRDLVRGGVVEPVWQADGTSFLYRGGGAPEPRLFDAGSGRSRPFIDAEQLGRALRQAAPSARFEPANLASATLRSDGIQVVVDGRPFAVGADGSVRAVTPEAAERESRRHPRRALNPYPSTMPALDETPSPDGDRLLTLAGANLAIRDAETGEVRQITADREPDLCWVLSGAKWAPDGASLAALRADTRQVPRLPLTHWLEDVNRVETLPLPIAGGAPVRQALALLDAGGATPRVVWAPEDGQMLRIAGFERDGRELRFLTLSRDHRRAELRAVDMASGDCRLILTEVSPTFLYWWEDVFQSLRFYSRLADGRFIWASERDGLNQLYLFDAAGALIRQLTNAAYPVERVVRIDEAAGRLFFLAHPDAARPYDTHLMRVGLGGGGLAQLSHAPGRHDVTFAPGGAIYLDVHASVSRPPRTEVRDADGALLETIDEADISALQRLGWSTPEPVCVKAADGRTELSGVIYKPIDFDPARTYPVVEYIYGGGFKAVTPHGFFPSDARGVFLQALVQLGFVGVVLDGRGTPGRSKAFQDVAHESFGQHESADHAAAIRGMAATRPYMDLDRVGIFGISFGGYFTVRCLLQQPDLYRAGVALSPAEIGRMTWDIAIAPYLGLADDNPEGYARAENAALADRLAGDLLMVVGSNDVNTPIAHTMRVVDALIRAGKPVDMLVVPEANHAFAYPDGGSAMPYVQSRIADYFLRRLRP